MKIALAELKTAIAPLVLNFVLEPCEKTQIPIKFENNSVTNKPAGGVWLKLSSRTLK